MKPSVVIPNNGEETAFEEIIARVRATSLAYETIVVDDEFQD